MMKKFIKAVSVLTAAFLFAGSLAACSGEPSESTASQNTTGSASGEEPIKVALVAWNPCMYLALAEELGYFEDAGVNVELVDFASYTDVPTAFNAGELDGAFFSSFETIAPYSMGVDLDVVAIADKSVGADALVAAKGYDTIESLKGKNIGVGLDTISHIYLTLLLEQNGYDIDDFNLVNLGPSEVAPALLSGQIDAATTFEPFVSIITSSGDGSHIVTDTSDTPDLVNDCIAFSGAVCEERSDDVAKIMKCWFDAIDYYDNHQQEAAEIMAKRLETSPEDFIATMDKLQMLSAEETDAMLTSGEWTATMQDICSFLLERGMIDNEVDMSGIVNAEIVEKAMSME
jgi:NitT/TauT family transport system substrate-binding protein